MKLAARLVVLGESLTLLCDLELLTPLSPEQVEAPRVLGHRVRAMMLTYLAQKQEQHYIRLLRK